MNPWLHFFVGTPRRFFTTLGILAVLFAMAWPVVAERALANLLGAVFGAIGPLEAPILTLVIIGAGFAILLKPLRKKKKKR